MTLVSTNALWRFVSQQKSWAAVGVPPETMTEWQTKMASVYHLIESVAGLKLSTTDDFDDLILMPVGQLLLDIPGSFWMRGSHPNDRFKRGWWRLMPGKAPNKSTPMTFDDTIARSKAYGPLAQGLVLVIDGNIGEVIRRWG